MVTTGPHGFVQVMDTICRHMHKFPKFASTQNIHAPSICIPPPWEGHIREVHVIALSEKKL